MSILRLCVVLFSLSATLLKTCAAPLAGLSSNIDLHRRAGGIPPITTVTEAPKPVTHPIAAIPPSHEAPSPLGTSKSITNTHPPNGDGVSLTSHNAPEAFIISNPNLNPALKELVLAWIKAKHPAIRPFPDMSPTSATSRVSAARLVSVQRRTTPFEPVIPCDEINYQIRDFEPTLVLPNDEASKLTETGIGAIGNSARRLAFSTRDASQRQLPSSDQDAVPIAGYSGSIEVYFRAPPRDEFNVACRNTIILTAVRHAYDTERDAGGVLFAVYQQSQTNPREEILISIFTIIKGSPKDDSGDESTGSSSHGTTNSGGNRSSHSSFGED